MPAQPIALVCMIGKTIYLSYMMHLTRSEMADESTFKQPIACVRYTRMTYTNMYFTDRTDSHKVGCTMQFCRNPCDNVRKQGT